MTHRNDSMNEMLAKLGELKLIPVVAIHDAADAPALAEAPASRATTRPESRARRTGVVSAKSLHIQGGV